MNRKLVVSVLLASLVAPLAAEEGGFRFREPENVSWSISYGFHHTDEKKSLPRLLMIGDSICNGYRDEVMRKLEGRFACSYWTSSYCVTSPGYLALLDFFLKEDKFAVIHFNNGLHSLGVSDRDWETAFRKAVELIRRRQPQAKVIWRNSTPLKDAKLTEKAKRLNAIAAKVVAEYGFATDDFFSRLDPLDRNANWSDTYHHVKALRDREADWVVEAVLKVGP